MFRNEKEKEIEKEEKKKKTKIMKILFYIQGIPLKERKIHSKKTLKLKI